MKQKEVKKVLEGTNNKENFETLLRKFENEYRKDCTSDTFAKVLQELATAIAYSVVKTCLDPQGRKPSNNNTVSDSGCSSMLQQVKNRIYFDTQLLLNTVNTCNKCYTFKTNEEGDTVNTIDSELSGELNKLITQNLGEGIDLVQTACVALLEQANKVDTEGQFLERTYKVNKLTKKTFVSRPSDLNKFYKEDETLPIKEGYRSVRKYIYDSGTLTIDGNGYTYIEDEFESHEGELDTIYLRTHKYSDIGGYVTDFNGSNTVYTANIDSYDRTNELIKALNLTRKQEGILRLRLEGLSVSEIAKRMNVTHQAVSKVLKQVQSKVVACNKFTSEKVAKAVNDTTVKEGCIKRKLTSSDYDSIKQLHKEGLSYTAIANKYGVSKMHISRICKG